MATTKKTTTAKKTTTKKTTTKATTTKKATEKKADAPVVEKYTLVNHAQIPIFNLVVGIQFRKFVRPEKDMKNPFIPQTFILEGTKEEIKPLLDRCKELNIQLKKVEE